MNFVDQAKVYVKAGDGGAGCVSFRRERYVPRGGPDGGDGGDGGDVIFQVVSDLNTLQTFRRRQHFKAHNGQAGRGKDQHGRRGADALILIPPGTLVRDAESGLVLQDFTEPGQSWVAARGGRGGRGNARFATATHQAPRYAQPGLPGEERWLALELKLLADVGLIGAPNAGKSTLLSRLSAARPKIAAYPFTTLTPGLGVVELSDERSFVLTDIPGLIEGAHRGVGMGLEFLRHVERTSVLLYVLDVSQGVEAVRKELELLQGEVKRHDAHLLEKPQAVALNKIDLVADETEVRVAAEGIAREGLPVYPVSALLGSGLPALAAGLYRMVAAEKVREAGDRTLGEEELADVWRP